MLCTVLIQCKTYINNVVSRVAEKSALLRCQNTEKGMLHCPLRGPSWPVPPQGSVFQKGKLGGNRSPLNLVLSRTASILKIFHLLLAYGGAIPSPSPKWVWLGAGHPAVIGPRVLQLPGWSLFGTAQVEPEPRFLGLGCLQTARHSSQRRTLCPTPARTSMSERMNTTEIFDGIRFPGFIHTLESLKAACAFQFQDTDILLVTFPKSGTTWMQQVLSLIFCKGHLWPIHHLPNWARMPWMEQISFSSLLPKLNSSWPRLLTSHLCAKVLAPALMTSKAKVVYMARNPKDTLVSFYHFHRIAGFLPDPDSFEDFVDEFLEGTGFFGSWFDHVKGWLGLQKDLNLLFVTYEELHQEPRRTIQKLCEFLGQPLAPEEEDVILEHCSFSFMSQSSMVNYSLISREIIDQNQGKFLRKGVVGDWKEHFTPELNEKFNAVYQSKMGDSGLFLPWTMD